MPKLPHRLPNLQPILMPHILKIRLFQMMTNRRKQIHKQLKTNKNGVEVLIGFCWVYKPLWLALRISRRKGMNGTPPSRNRHRRTLPPRLRGSSALCIKVWFRRRLNFVCCRRAYGWRGGLRWRALRRVGLLVSVSIGGWFLGPRAGRVLSRIGCFGPRLFRKTASAKE